MRHSIQEMKRSIRRRLKRVVQKHADANYRRRANAMLLLHAGSNKAMSPERLHCPAPPYDLPPITIPKYKLEFVFN